MKPFWPTARPRPSTRARGAAAERRAERYYRLRGFRVLERNVWAGGHELDLVLRRGRRLVFSEVKMKLDSDFGEPFEMVDAEKQRRLRQAAEAWLARNPACAGLDIRFDVVSIGGSGIERIHDAF